jgi:hypothetical protein
MCPGARTAAYGLLTCRFKYVAFEDKDKKDHVDVVKYKAYDQYGNYDWCEVYIYVKDDDHGKKPDDKPYYDLMT